MTWSIKPRITPFGGNSTGVVFSDPRNANDLGSSSAFCGKFQKPPELERELIAHQLAARLSNTLWHFRREAGLLEEKHLAEQVLLVFAALAVLGGAEEER
jgi:hypothetical protein